MNHSAAREGSRAALVVCGMFPDLHATDHPLRDALRARGVVVDAVRWDDPAADWSGYDLVVIRQTWDYPPRRDAFVDWARSVPRLANPADVVAWNTDKRYLADLAGAGVAVTPTTYLIPGTPWTPPATGEWVVKPTVSVSSQDTGRYVMPDQAGLAQAHLNRLHAAGRTGMLQPYLNEVDFDGETALVFLAGVDGGLEFSHAVRKGPLLTGPDEGRPHAGYTEDISPREPSEAELALARAALAAAPGGLLYARVDVFPGPVLAELELTEPSLFLEFAPGSGDRFTEAVLRRL